MEQQLNSDHETDMLTVVDVCEKLQVSRWTVYQLMRNGRLSSVKIGKRRLVPKHRLEEFVRRLEESRGG